MAPTKENFPHKKRIAALAAVFALAVVLIEITPAGPLIFESGLIHSFAVLFSMAALYSIYALHKVASDGSIRLFSRYLAAAIAIAGLAHVYEYFGETLHLLSDSAVLPGIGSLYLAAGSLVIFGANAMLRRANDDAWMLEACAILLVCVQCALVWLQISGRASESFAVKSFGVVLFLTTLSCVVVVRRIALKFPLLSQFAKTISVGGCLLFVSFLFEVFFDKLEQLGLSEWRIENAMHYVFYLGMSVMLLSFDFLRHFSGIYADIRKEFDPHEA